MTWTAKSNYLLGLVLAALGTAMLVLGSGAVGIIGAGEADVVYLGVVVVGAVGALVARLRPSGMAVTLAAMAATQLLAPLVAFGAGMPGTQEASVVDVVALTVAFAGLFLASAWLFSRSRGAHGSVA